jgi:hypothetical protein
MPVVHNFAHALHNLIHLFPACELYNTLKSDLKVGRPLVRLVLAMRMEVERDGKTSVMQVPDPVDVA